jgi:hypothetical protein
MAGTAESAVKGARPCRYRARDAYRVLSNGLTSTATAAPGLLYLIALKSKLIRICFIRVRSALTKVCDPEFRKRQADARVCACDSISARHSYMTSGVRRLGGQRQLARFDQREIEDLVDQLEQVPAGLEDLVDVSLLRRRRVGAPDSSSCAKPRIALSGVRNSWLIPARKSDLARLAFSGRGYGVFIPLSTRLRPRYPCRSTDSR